jgi:hypothetical protein
MRNAAFLFILFFAIPASAQPPVIDSMLIDESKGILSIYGQFGAVSGRVFCDSLQLPVITWSDSLITSLIPDSGKGSAGMVAVEAGGILSEQREITLWKVTVLYHAMHIYSNSLYEETAAHFFLQWRLDLRSKLRNRFSGDFFLYGMKSSSSNQSYINQISNQYQNFDTTNFPYLVKLSFDKKLFNFDLRSKIYVQMVGGLYFGEPVYMIDSQFMVLPGILSDGNGTYIQWDNSSISFLPPPKSLSLQNNPTLIAPSKNYSNIGPDNVHFVWDTLKLMDEYHLQISLDSTFKTNLCDTTSASHNFTYPKFLKTTKYFWRVCGVNSEGESRWSDVWNFTTGEQAEVKAAYQEEISLSCYPNPASKELTIHYTTASNATAKILLYDMNGKLCKKPQYLLPERNETRYNVSDLPNGSYILGLITETGKQSTIIKIVR